MRILQKFVYHYSRRRFACLFGSLIVTLVAAPVLGALGISTRFMEAFLALNILAAGLVTLFSFRTYVGWGLLILILSARGGYALLDYEPFLSTSRGIGVAVCLLSVFIMLRFVLSEGSINSERIFASLNVYLLMAIMCGLLFCVFEEVWPGSFAFQGSPGDENKRVLLARTLYFSFVTLGTLGYGDIIPISNSARALAVTEAIVGQMYLAVVVARLVSLYRGRTSQSDRSEVNESLTAPDEPRR